MSIITSMKKASLSRDKTTRCEFPALRPTWGDVKCREGGPQRNSVHIVGSAPNWVTVMLDGSEARPR